MQIRLGIRLDLFPPLFLVCGWLALFTVVIFALAKLIISAVTLILKVNTHNRLLARLFDRLSLQ
jgi:hypothetical protein